MWFDLLTKLYSKIKEREGEEKVTTSKSKLYKTKTLFSLFLESVVHNERHPRLFFFFFFFFIAFILQNHYIPLTQVNIHGLI
jgi:hypothetical protein